tara:strand:+ start:269 stop:601 length:333 start_codon:yes stop_codon:yes gene_type:complete
MRLYHNPRCSKSRQAVQLLRERNIKFEEHLYLKLGINDEDIDLLSHLPGIVRINDVNESERDNVEDPKVVKSMLTNNPKIMQRPVLVDEGKAIIGRPPENILALLHDNKS